VRVAFWALARRARGEASGWPDRPLPRPCVGSSASVDEIEWVVKDFRARYFDFTAKHFHESIPPSVRFATGPVDAEGRGISFACPPCRNRKLRRGHLMCYAPGY
jgi:hypothetical protein